MKTKIHEEIMPASPWDMIRRITVQFESCGLFSLMIYPVKKIASKYGRPEVGDLSAARNISFQSRVSAGFLN